MEYIQEGIDWTGVGYLDNADCLNLFEKKPLGLLSLLDEESASPKATDLTFEYKLKMHLNGSSCFNGETDGAFQVGHYAGQVLYDTTGFTEKNRDLLSSDCIQLLLSCDCPLSQLFASHMLQRTQNPLGSSRRAGIVDSQKQSIATKFKGQVFNLMQQLECTTPHFIQCIRPNNTKGFGTYEDERVLQQLRCCGILEVVRLSKSGYPTRMTHQQFALRYGFLLLRKVVSEDPLDIAVAVLQKLHILPEMYQVGYTMLFFRTGQIVALEKIRSHTVQKILWIQKSRRGFHDRKSFLDLKRSATILQSVIRYSLVRKNFMGTQTSHKTVDSVPVQNNQNQVSALVELEMQIQKVEVELRQKEDENTVLKQQLQENEKRCWNTEERMKSMEESWQKQMTSMQMNLQAMKKAQQQGTPDASPAHRPVDASPADARTPEGTPARPAYVSNVTPTRNTDSNQNAVGHLGREFEQQKRVFEDNARVLAETKPGQSGSSANPKEDLRKLKAQFTSWQKDYKSQLKVARAKIHKLVVPDEEKPHKKWWKVKRCCKKKKKK